MTKIIIPIALLLLALFFSRSCSPTASVSGEIDGHEYVDLGLPSGTLWATCNLGASQPYEAGKYYAWGEVEEKEDYSWETYKWCQGSDSTLTKYNLREKNGVEDNKTTLDPEDDAATVNWGENWQMPTVEDIKELYELNRWWVDNYKGTGVSGCMYLGKNGKKLFIPVTGHFYKKKLVTTPTQFNYFSASLLTDTCVSQYFGNMFYYTRAYTISKCEAFYGWWYGECFRFYGLPIRAVSKKRFP